MLMWKVQFTSGLLCLLAVPSQSIIVDKACPSLGRVYRSEKMDDGSYTSFRESAASVSAPLHGEPNRLSSSALKKRIADARLLSFCEPMRLHRINPSLFQRIQEEVSQIMTTSSGASVLSEKHPIAWVKAFGDAKSFSLITASGSLNDTSDLLNFDTRQKRFSQAAKYPALADFIELFPHTTNWRINVLGPSDSCDAKGTGFSPHRAFVLHEVADEAGNAKTAFRMKFHLPILAQTDLVDMHQHDQSYEFELGDVYYFTNGCRHAVENRAPVPRVHIIWDMLLTEDTFERMLGEGADLSEDVVRMRTTADRTVKSKGKWTTTDVEQEPEKTWATMQVFFNDLIDASPPKECRIAMEDAHLLHAPDEVSQKEASLRHCKADWALVSRRHQETNKSFNACSTLGRVHRSEKMPDGTYVSFRESIASVSAPVHGEPNRLSSSALKNRIANSRLLSFCEPMRLHRINPGLFQRIQDEVSQIMTTSSGASVLSEKHPIAWVKAFGEAKSFSLITASGSLNDTSDLLNFDTRKKRFSQADKYPALADFIELFPDTTNWRINVLGPSDSCDAKGTGFSPHRAFVLHEVADEAGNAKTAFRMKFHLPIFAQTELVDMHQHDQSYEFELGDVYYFTNGCRHAVENRAPVPRVHIIWDMLLTEDTFERMLGEGADLSEDVVRMRSTTDRTVKSKGEWATTDVEQEPEKTWATMQVFFKDLIDATPPKECRISIEDAHLLHAPDAVSQREALERSCGADWALVSRWSQELDKQENVTRSNRTCLDCAKDSMCLSEGRCVLP